MEVWRYVDNSSWGAKMFKNQKLYGERPSVKRINKWI
jgi:hypothetical protein